MHLNRDGKSQSSLANAMGAGAVLATEIMLLLAGTVQFPLRLQPAGRRPAGPVWNLLKPVPFILARRERCSKFHPSQEAVRSVTITSWQKRKLLVAF